MRPPIRTSDSITTKLRLSILVELLGQAINMQYNIFFADPDQFSKEELESLQNQIERYELESGKVTGYWSAIQNQIEKYGN
jgi:hypothetical protein